MRYPIAIEPGTDATAWGVVVPDLPGCFSAGDTLEDALIQAEEGVSPAEKQPGRSGATTPHAALSVPGSMAMG